MNNFKCGDEVYLRLPNGWRKGKVAQVRYNYLGDGETRYEIHGPGFTTISRPPTMTKENPFQSGPCAWCGINKKVLHLCSGGENVCDECLSKCMEI